MTIPPSRKYAVNSSWFPRVRHFDEDASDSDEPFVEEKPLYDKKPNSFPQMYVF